jgi:hypothetical protein
MVALFRVPFYFRNPALLAERSSSYTHTCKKKNCFKGIFFEAKKLIVQELIYTYM